MHRKPSSSFQVILKQNENVLYSTNSKEGKNKRKRTYDILDIFFWK